MNTPEITCRKAIVPDVPRRELWWEVLVNGKYHSWHPTLVDAHDKVDDLRATYEQHRQHDTEEAIVASFKNFNKWETYGLCYKALKTGAVTLAKIQRIAWREAQIKPDIIEMRMTDFDKMGAK